jgi:hypothetical protein
VKPKKPNLKRGGWKESPLRPHTPEGKKRHAAYLRNCSIYIGQLMFAEAKRR